MREEPGKPHLIFNWRIPGRADGRSFAITGFLGYVPPRGAGGGGGGGVGGWLVAAGVAGWLTLAAVAIAVGARRLGRRAP